MTDKPGIPKKIYDRVVAFLRTGATGQITMNVHQGRIQTVAIADHFRADDDPVMPIETPALPLLKTR